MVGSAASDLSKDFHQESLMPMFQLSLILFSSLTKVVNARYLIKIRHVVRIFVNSINMMIGFLIISFVCTYKDHEVSFWLSLVASIILGTASALGESTTLGFIKGFPSSVVGYFGSGTGFAGMFGSGIILILKGAGLTNGQIFFIVTPTVIPYFLSFWWIYNIKEKHEYIHEDKQANSHSQLQNSQSVLTDDDETTDKNILVNGTSRDQGSDHFIASPRENNDQQIQQLNEAKNNTPLDFTTFKGIFLKVGFFQINLMAVYFLEYMCTTCFADRITNKLQRMYPERKSEYVFANGFIILSFSFSYKQKYFYVLFAIMVWVGLMGGGSYVNVMYQILESPNLQRNEKELALTITTVCNDIGILAASLLALLLDNTAFKSA